MGPGQLTKKVRQIAPQTGIDFLKGSAIMIMATAIVFNLGEVSASNGSRGYTALGHTALIPRPPDTLLVQSYLWMVGHPSCQQLFRLACQGALRDL